MIRDDCAFNELIVEGTRTTFDILVQAHVDIVAARRPAHDWPESERARRRHIGK
jgi:hypothetical protein